MCVKGYGQLMYSFVKSLQRPQVQSCIWTVASNECNSFMLLYLLEKTNLNFARASLLIVYESTILRIIYLRLTS